MRNVAQNGKLYGAESVVGENSSDHYIVATAISTNNREYELSISNNNILSQKTRKLQ